MTGPLIATLTVNPAVDVSAEVDRLEPERKLRCEAVRHDPGGGGVNVARVIRRLGGDALAVLAAGGDAGARLSRLLAAEGVETRAVPIAGETREDFTALDRSSGRQYRFVLPGPQLARAELQRIVSQTVGLTPKPSVVVASGSLPPGAPPDLYGRLARRLARRGVRMALDASGPALAAGLAAGVWLAKPNLRELA
ncbi:MAG TPA: PfkB family carbohydrate kinase, partial [Caulobacteraceae bacterium]|nr:PfkB family carbohydrate kinase [Caulobacteraceae bacterium]